MQVNDTLASHIDSVEQTLTYPMYKDMDPTLLMSVSDGTDHSIRNFLERPTQIAQIAWTISDAQNTVIAQARLPESLIGAIAMIGQKVTGFLGFRATTCLRLQVNANRFQQGKLLMTYFPNDLQNFQKYQSVSSDLIYRTQLPRVELDAAVDTQVEFEIPWINSELYFNTVTGRGHQGLVDVTVYSPLLTIGSEVSVDTTLFMYFKDVKLVFPAVSDPTVVAQSGKGRTVSLVKSSKASRDLSEKEQSSSGQKPISSALSIAARVSSIAAEVPILSSIAGPASWALNIGSNIASSFGFSKPIQGPTQQVMVQRLATNYTHSDGIDGSTNLSMLADNKVEVLPGFSGTDIDEMAFGHILSIPTFIQQFTWHTTDIAGTSMALMYASPLQRNIAIGVTSNVDGSGAPLRVFHCTPMAYLANHFDLWRGSICFRIKFVKTEFHSGRILIAFFPGNKIAYSLADTLYVHREIVDIRYVNEIDFVVPYVATTPYKNVGELDSLDLDKVVGNVQIYVLNELRAPDTVTQSINVLIETYAGNDFEFAVPRPAMSMPLYFQAGDVEVTDEKPTLTEASEAGPVGGSQNINDGHTSSRYCIGERILSLRQLMKRSTVWFKPVDNQGFFLFPHQYNVPVRPPNAAATPIVFSGTYPDYYCHFMPCFAYYRGSMRIKIIPETDTVPLIRAKLVTSGMQYVNSAPGGITTGGAVNTAKYPSCYGYTLTYSQQNPIIELQVPYYSNRQTTISINRGDPVASQEDVPHMGVYITEGGPTPNISTQVFWRSIGEDFSSGFWTGTIPLMFADTSVSNYLRPAHIDPAVLPFNN